jgi:carbamoyl-phosphate synthase large subunit
VPYVSKATGVPLPKIAVGVMLGRKLKDFEHMIGETEDGVLRPPKAFVKSPVFPLNKFPGVDPALGPEMRSTGEVMGVGENFGEAFAKAQLSAGTPLPAKGTVFISVNDRHKSEAIDIARRLSEFGFGLVATRGTATALQIAGIKCKTIFKVNEGRPNAVDLLKAGTLQLVIYTATGAHSFSDEKIIRRTAVAYRVPCITTISAAKAAAEAVASHHRDPIRVWSLQEIHASTTNATEPRPITERYESGRDSSLVTPTAALDS